MTEIKNILSVFAIAGNLLFVMWIFYNGANEGFEGTIIEKISYITLMGLLIVNSLLLVMNFKKRL